MAFAVGVKDLCVDLRRQPIAWNTAAQLLDASTSLSANYRATSRARSRADLNSKMGVVAEEADEAVHWLEFVLVSKLSCEERPDHQIKGSTDADIADYLARAQRLSHPLTRR